MLSLIDSVLNFDNPIANTLQLSQSRDEPLIYSIKTYLVFKLNTSCNVFWETYSQLSVHVLQARGSIYTSVSSTVIKH